MRARQAFSNAHAQVMSVEAGIRFMLISVVFFALMNLTVKFLSRLPATEIVLFRSGISLILSLIFLSHQKIQPFGKHRLLLFLRGLFGASALTLFFYTLQKLPLGTAITIQYLSPIFTVLFAALFLNERTSPVQFLFFALSFFGILLIRGFDPQMNALLLGLGITSSIFAGLAYVVIRRLSGKEHPMVVVLYFPLVSLPVMAVFSFFYWETPVGVEWVLILLMGLFTQIAQYYMTKAFQANEVRVVAGLKYLGIVFALSFDFFIFNYQHSWLALAGMALVVMGVVMNIFFGRRQRKAGAQG